MVDRLQITKNCSPRRLVYLEGDHDRSSASRRETQIKKLRPADKWRLMESSVNRLFNR